MQYTWQNKLSILFYSKSEGAFEGALDQEVNFALISPIDISENGNIKSFKHVTKPTRELKTHNLNTFDSEQKKLGKKRKKRQGLFLRKCFMSHKALRIIPFQPLVLT